MVPSGPTVCYIALRYLRRVDHSCEQKSSCFRCRRADLQCSLQICVIVQQIESTSGPMANSAVASAGNKYKESGKAAGPCVIVLFGAAGDLTKRKLVPALFNLVKAKLLPKDFAVVGVSVDDLSLEQFRNQITGFLHSE